MNQLDYLTGKNPNSARPEFAYFGDDGDLMAYRDERFEFIDLQAYRAFPPRQTPTSFSIDQIIEKLSAGTKGK